MAPTAIAVDFDGTLATFDHWRGVEHTGEPIQKMVTKVQQAIADGKDVRIFTARVCSKEKERERAKKVIEQWCLLHIGTMLPVTAEKDYEVGEYWDDRARQVTLNTGEFTNEDVKS